MSREQRLVRPLITIFICWNLFALAVWIAPLSPQRSRLLTLIEPYMFTSGLNQDFLTFSPNADRANAELVALITMANGSTLLWQYPRMYEMNLVEKLFRERYRIFGGNLLDRRSDYLLPDAARHIARIVYKKNSGNPPVSVVLQVRWQEIVAPDSKLEPKAGRSNIFQYKVEAVDLK